MAVTKSKKKVVKKVSHGIAHVVATNKDQRKFVAYNKIKFCVHLSCSQTIV